MRRYRTCDVRTELPGCDSTVCDNTALYWLRMVRPARRQLIVPRNTPTVP